MFQFLNPYILGALAAAALPIIIHFLSRRRLKRIEFSSLRFLKKLEKQQIRRIRFYQWLILLFRTLFVIFLILYLSRPVLPTFKSGDSTQSINAAIILDNSFSMQATPGQQDLVRISREQTRHILNSFGRADRILLAATQNGRLVEQTFPFTLKAHQAEIQPASFPPQLLYQQLKDWFKSNPAAQTELYFISDQRLSGSVFSAELTDSLRALAEQAWFIRSGQPGALNNLGIDSAWIENRVFRSGRPLHLFCRIRNDYSENLTATVHLFLNDSRRAMQSLEVSPGQTALADFRISEADSGWKRVSFELEEDDLAEDNRYYLNFYARPLPRVQFVLSEDNQPLAILSQVFLRSRLIDLRPDAPELIIGDEISVLQPAVQTAMLKGAALLMIPSSTAGTETLNRCLAALPVPESFRAAELVKLAEGSFITLPVSAIQSGLDLSLPAEPAIRLRQYFQWPESAGQIIELGNSQPFLIRSGQIFVVNTSLHDDWSNLAVNPGFVPLMSRLIDIISAADQNGPPLQIVCGQPAMLPIRPEWWPETLYFGPAAESGDPVPDAAYSGRLLMRTAPIGQAGQYELRRGEDILSLVSVNLPADELRQPLTDLAQHGFDELVWQDETGLQKQLKEKRQGLEISYWLLILAVLMLAAEMFVLWRVEKESV